MSSEEEDRKLKTARRCSVCNVEIQEATHTGVNCPAHYLCNDCSPVFVQSIMGEPERNLPPKCPMRCGAEIVAATFERNLSDDQRLVYIQIRTARELQPGEMLSTCPFCQYFEVKGVHTGGDLPFPGKFQQPSFPLSALPRRSAWAWT